MGRTGLNVDRYRSGEKEIAASMAVYVDSLRDYGWRHGPSCHLIADSIDELMEFAVGMGLKPEWFQPKSSPHFDLTESGRELAVERGAVEVNQRELIAIIRKIRAAAKQFGGA